MGFYELRRQLEYKTKKNQRTLICADRYFSSSKTCSNCKEVTDELPLSARHWKCQNCEIIHDRDLNAAINLANYAVSSTVKACGDNSSDCIVIPCSKTVTMKQEVNTK
jgi:putative transposase